MYLSQDLRLSLPRSIGRATLAARGRSGFSPTAAGRTWPQSNGRIQPVRSASVGLKADLQDWLRFVGNQVGFCFIACA
ncbi:MAG: hypothetical protein A2514_03670 [Gammaproteobacteria bacterium RIFOXYD12_FULL_61_37]|nr:MAG: hypothetical protein A2514_03670 [Gammaproteobacteria bacterium RIFOXYD12_FULL_61_37]